METYAKKLKEIPKGEFFKRQPNAKKVYIKGEYDRTEKDYSCINAEDINNEIFIKGDKNIYIGFDY